MPLKLSELCNIHVCIKIFFFFFPFCTKKRTRDVVECLQLCWFIKLTGVCCGCRLKSRQDLPVSHHWVDEMNRFYFVHFLFLLSHCSQCQRRGVTCAATRRKCCHGSHASCVPGQFSNQKSQFSGVFTFFLERANGKV